MNLAPRMIPSFLQRKNRTNPMKEIAQRITMIGAFCMATFGAKAQVVYTNDFSGGTTIVTHTNNGNFKVGTGDAGDQNASGSFSYNTTRTPENGVQEIDPGERFG